MKLMDVLKLSHQIIQDTGAPHALIGAFGMSAHGYQRATNDIDYLVDGDFRPQIESEFKKKGFRLFNSSDDVIQFEGPGSVDIIFARRPMSKEMLGRNNLTSILEIPVLAAEDIIGLKIQALTNEPRRKFKELGDIQALCQIKKLVDWDRIQKYAELFNAWDIISEIKNGIARDN